MSGVLTVSDLIRLKNEELLLAEKRLLLEQELPHLYGWKFYKWSRLFFDSKERETLLCAANQISKSSTQIRKSIHWSTETSLWPALWPRRPLQFWYFYPTYQVATIEFRKKWIPEFLPRGSMIENEKYGWRPEWKNGVIVAVHFKSEVSIYFKTYAMDVQDLQTGSVDAVFLDEECPEELLDEIRMRLVARQGYFHAVFTPTLGQEVWRRAFEEKGKKLETFKDAFKQQVSMFDCLFYEDGSKSPWTLEAIQRAMNSCKSDAQVQRRIYGRCVSDEGLKYASFSRGKNMTEDKSEPPAGWDIFVGADIGSGEDNHPAAVVFVAVNPERTRGVVFKGWRGDDVVTTASDVAHRVKMMSAGLKVERIFYDYSSRDFYTIASGMDLEVEAAEKSHSVGEQVLNVLFRNRLLSIYDSPDLDALCVELTTLKASTPKRVAKDDYCDALRYAVTKINWDWSILNVKVQVEEPKPKTEIELRRDFHSVELLEAHNIEAEFSEWNQLFQPDYMNE
jgi:hypothetical protein